MLDQISTFDAPVKFSALRKFWSECFLLVLIYGLAASCSGDSSISKRFIATIETAGSKNTILYDEVLFEALNEEFNLTEDSIQKLDGGTEAGTSFSRYKISLTDDSLEFILHGKLLVDDSLSINHLPVYHLRIEQIDVSARKSDNDFVTVWTRKSR